MLKLPLSLKSVEILFLGIFISLGLWACINIGLSWDEGIEFKTWAVNRDAVMGLFSGNRVAYDALLNYSDRYYGIGFHLLANGLSSLLYPWMDLHLELSAEGTRLLFNHFGTFLAFIGSGYLVRALLLQLTHNRLIATLGMGAYLLWPYLLGHGLMNIKDMPFLFVWLACTYLVLKLFLIEPSGLSPSKHQGQFNLLLLGLLTGWLLSIRISGVLIFIEYGVLAMSYLLLNRNPPLQIHFLNSKSLLLFVLGLIVSYGLLSPILWHDPREFLNAIRYMSHHPWDGDTLTWGNFMSSSKERYFLYIPYWLFVKLPIMIIIGIAALPLALFNLHKQNAVLAKSALFTLVGLAASVLAIILTLCLTRTPLYNELRQILFLFPVLYIIGLTSLFYVNKKIALIGLVLSAVIFIWDDIVLHPYEYTYLNEIVRQLKDPEDFEKDYIGISAGKNARWLNHSQLTVGSDCLYATPLHLWQYQLNLNQYPCLKDFSARSFDYQNTSFLLATINRNNANLLPMPSCKVVHCEERTLPLSTAKLVFGKVYWCRPEFLKP